MNKTKAFLKKYHKWFRLLLKIAIMALFIWFLFGVLIGLQRVEGVSMSHRVEDGDLVLFSRTDKTYYPDDVVLYERDNKTHVSSILASPGDIITIDEVGRLYVNGARVSDTAVYNIDQGEKPTITFPVRVPDGSYFLLNENLEDEDDSRSFGAIFKQQIKGKIVSIFRTRSI